MKPRPAGLVDGRNLGRGRRTAVCGDRVGLQLAAPQMAEHSGHLGELQIEPPGDQILQRRRDAAIGHDLQAGAGHVLERHRQDMRSAAFTERADRHRAGAGSQPGDQVAKFVGQFGSGDERGRAGRQQGDRLEVLQHVVANRIDEAADHETGLIAADDGVAVRCGARRALDTHRTGSRRDVLDHHRLTERLTHALGHDARDNVHSAAGRVRHDHHHGPGRIVLGLARLCGPEKPNQGDTGDELSHCSLRWIVPKSPGFATARNRPGFMGR